MMVSVAVSPLNKSASLPWLAPTLTLTVGAVLSTVKHLPLIMLELPARSVSVTTGVYT